MYIECKLNFIVMSNKRIVPLSKVAIRSFVISIWKSILRSSTHATAIINGISSRSMHNPVLLLFFWYRSQTGCYIRSKCCIRAIVLNPSRTGRGMPRIGLTFIHFIFQLSNYVIVVTFRREIIYFPNYSKYARLYVDYIYKKKKN